jgi:glutaminase
MDAIPASNSPLQLYLAHLYDKYKDLDDGAVADYIPELAHANPDWFGITLVTVDGHIYQVGDTHQDFTIQSISKVISYGLALQEHGIKHVISKVGVEPSGDAFNSISLDPVTGQPRNPMINAGAIATTGLIKGGDSNEKLQRLLDVMGNYVSHKVTVNEAVYESESLTGHRNRAIGHMLRNFDILESDPEPTLDLYFKQCSINVNCRDLGVMAACFANNGINPITGVIALESPFVHKVLSVMGSCGMYNYSGNWLYHVGMPAKSGVGGGIIAVLPGQFGLAVFSPRLDELGNSVRGIKVCEAISSDFGLHLYHSANSTSASVIRVKYTGKQVRSRKSRNSDEKQYLDQHGHRIVGYELQGELMFGSAESLINDIMLEAGRQAEYFIIDLLRIAGIDHASSKLLCELVSTLHHLGKKLYFTNKQDNYRFVRFIEKNLQREISHAVFEFADRDHALEYCENQLLPEAIRPDINLEHELRDHYLCQGLTDEELLHLREVAIEKEFRAGEIIVNQAEVADSMFFIRHGEIEVIMKIDHKREKRLATLLPGMTFGELAMLNHNERTASGRAIVDTACYEVKFEDIDPPVRIKMLTNLANILASKLALDAKEISVMS